MIGVLIFLGIIGFIGFRVYTQPVNTALWVSRQWLSLSGFKKKTVMTSKGKISYFEGGVGKPLVLLHGFMAEGGNWFRVAKALKQKYRVLIPDLPGHGDSDDLVTMDLNAIGEAVAEFIEKAPGHPKVYLAGHSMGGWLAMRYAMQNPQKIHAIVLENAAGLQWAIDRDLLLADNHQNLKKKLKMMFDPKRNYNYPSFVLDDIINMNEPKYFQLYDSMGQGNFVDSGISMLQVPTLLLWGEQDGFFPMTYANKLKNAIPNAKMVTFPASAHIPHVTDHKAYSKAMLSFLSGK